jgi:inosine/xanthosine triphosphatase
MKIVIVASKNPVKINSVKEGFHKMFPQEEFSFVGISVPSHVQDQPMNNEETLIGAKNRAKNAQKEQPQANYFVGIEGGIEKTLHGMEVFAWIVIISKEKEGKAKTGTFFLPTKIIQLIEAGKELGEANDIVFGQHNSKQHTGAVGILTQDLITRTSYYVEAVILALIPFKNKELY